jgi:hypothetical protein
VTTGTGHSARPRAIPLGRMVHIIRDIAFPNLWKRTVWIRRNPVAVDRRMPLVSCLASCGCSIVLDKGWSSR